MPFQIDILAIIPDGVKNQIRDTLVDFVTDQAKKYVGEELAGKIKQLRSDGAFKVKFEKGLQAAMERFIAEYEVQDEDLVAAIARDRTLFANDEFQDALMAVLKNPSGSLVKERMDLRRSFDSVLPDRVNRERVDQAINYFLKCLAEELWHLPELQPIYSLQFQRLTAEATSQQVALQKAQLKALTDISAGVRDALLQLTDAISARKALPSGESQVDIPHARVIHNLPQPGYGRFIGREGELDQVMRILRPYPHSQEHVVSIDGVGGIGKSALALEVAQRYLRNYEQIPSEERFEAIIWVSAKQAILTGEGIVARRAPHRTLNDIFSAIAITLDREDIPHAKFEAQPDLVRKALTRQRTLLIVDNFETIDDENVLTFLRELPAPTKAIVTTRHRIDVAYPVRLTGLPWNDAYRLINLESKKKSVHLTKKQAGRLYRYTGGLPLALVWSIAQMGMGSKIDIVTDRLHDVEGDVARFCFEQAFQIISGKPAHKILTALSLFATDGRREALGYVTEASNVELNDGLVELEKLSLVNKTADRFSMLPLTRQFTIASLGDREKDLNELRERWVSFYIREANLWFVERLKLFQQESLNIKGVLDWCELNARKKEFIQILSKIGWPIWISGLWSDWRYYVELGMRYADQIEDKTPKANFYEGMAVQAFFRRDYPEAEHKIQYAIQHYKANGMWQRYLTASVFLGQTQIQLGQHAQAEETLLDALHEAEERSDKGRTVRAMRHLGELRIAQGDYEDAEKWLEDAKRLQEERAKFDSMGMAIIKRLFANLYMKTELYEQALTCANEALAIMQKLGSRYDIAVIDHVLFDIYAGMGKQAQAARVANEAIGLFEDFGLSGDAQELRSKLERLLGADDQDDEKPDTKQAG